MNTEQEVQKSMDLAEDSRQTEWKFPSFTAALFQGKFHWKSIHPYNFQEPTDKQKGDALIEKLRPLLATQLDPLEVDRTGKLPPAFVSELKKLGCFGMKIPTKYGGLGLSNTNYTRVISFISSYCASTAVMLSAHQSIGVPQPLKMYGSQKQKDSYFPRLAKGALSAFALTEPGVGSDPAQMTTTARLTEDGNTYIINGTKLWCTNGPEAEVIILMAATQSKEVDGKEKKQISAFIVESNTPGFEVAYKCEFMGLKGIVNGVLKFKDMKIPAENLLHKEGFGLKIALETLNAGRLAIPVCSVAVSKQCMRMTRKWTSERVQWGKKVGDHQSVASYLADTAVDTYAMDSLSKTAVNLADNPNADIRLEAAIAKYYCSEIACRIADDALQVKGGRGYETATSLAGRGESPDAIEQIIRDIRINRIIEGSSEIMQLFIAREAVDFHFAKIMPFLKAKSLGQKLKLALKLGLHYGKWLPKLYLPRLKNYKTQNLHGENKAHLRYISRTSRRMARRLFFTMVKYQIKLQDEQKVLAQFVDIGTKLFAMACVLSRTDSYPKTEREKHLLAQEFCRKTKREITEHFKAVSEHKQRLVLKKQVAKNILNNKYCWLETEDVF